MSAADKLKNKVQEVGGSAKQHIGKATGDRQTEAEGRADKAKGHLKDAGEHVKDVFKA